MGLTLEFGFPVLSTLVFLPALGALVCLLIPRERAGALRAVPLVFAVATGLLALLISLGFEPRAVGSETQVAYQFAERMPWIGPLGVEYSIGLDGISMLMVLLTALLGIVAVLASWTSIEHRIKEYMICLLLLETAMLGVFVALDLVLFYVFWESMLIPMVLIIGAWGGPRRVYAAVKFFIFTMFGSVLMLVGILWLHHLTGTFSIPELAARAPAAVAASQGELLFLLFGIAFAIKVPLVPLHTWLPDAHTEAPTAGSILLAGVLLKMGAYGFLRMCVPFFPAATVAFAPALVWLGVIGILYGGACALAQRDVKRLVAYSSVSHLGFVILGVF
ncbi:MAG TPA: NADH-quinone oxidoreductase subunit M, partial [Armatimonadota bacterium]|nr:NADH-quinone oxidoreductase subunit M [Armatimonadota bacterium]